VFEVCFVSVRRCPTPFVAPGRPEHKLSVFVAQPNGGPVKFQLGHIGKIIMPEIVFYSFVKLIQLLFVVGIVEAEQRYRVGNSFEVAVGFTAHPPGG
jgi:hypothetical protein